MENVISRNNQNLYLAVIAGGQGTRLFPHSHDGKPKQFCQLDAEHTFIQATVDRFLNLGIKTTHVVIVTTNPNQTKLANRQLASLGVLSQNVVEISPECGYAGAMVEAAKFIKHLNKDAIIINTPSDQHIIADEKFATVIARAVENSLYLPTLVGVKISDRNTVMGCGHALYDPNETSVCKTVSGFVEKPDEITADRLMREDRSVVNTGINVWSVKNILAATSKLKTTNGLETDQLMNLFPHLSVAIGRFAWYDCGTLQSLYDISKKTPNHKNANLGEGEIYRHNCLGSLFIGIAGITIMAAGARNVAVVVNEIDSHLVVAIVKLSESQRVRKLAEDYQLHSDFLTADFSVGARNNRVSYTSISNEISVGFVGVHDYTVTVLKNQDGNIIVSVSNDGLEQTT